MGRRRDGGDRRRVVWDLWRNPAEEKEQWGGYDRVTRCVNFESCCHFIQCFFFLSDRETFTSHHRSSLACPFVFTFVTLLTDVQCEAHTLINAHRAVVSLASEGWLSRWCIMVWSTSASTLRRPWRKSASTDHSVSLCAVMLWKSLSCVSLNMCRQLLHNH